MKTTFLTLAVALSLSLSGIAHANCSAIDLPTHLRFGEHEHCDGDYDLAVVLDEQNRHGFFDIKAGKIAIKPQFDEAWNFQESLALIKKDDKWGYLKSDGSYAIKPTYDDAWGFSEGLGKVKQGDKVGFINPQNQVVIPIVYDDSAHWFNEGRGVVSQNNKWAVIDNKGKRLTKFDYDFAAIPSEGRILVGNLGRDDELKYGFLDLQGKVVIALTYDFATPFDGGTSLVMENGDSLVINPYGTPVDTKDDYADFGF